jgi:hypothetical protein
MVKNVLCARFVTISLCSVSTYLIMFIHLFILYHGMYCECALNATNATPTSLINWFLDYI